jgi:hypothetical protein
MMASSRAGEPTRFERARRLAAKVREGLPTVPGGLASITDRSLPHLFPTVDSEAFAAVLERTIGIDRPPPGDSISVRITTLGSLAQIASQNYFSTSATRRLLVLFSDGRQAVRGPTSPAFRRPPRCTPSSSG